MNEGENSKEVLTITHKELGYGLAVVVVGLFFVFAGGYFLGKKRALEDLVMQYDDECFADKISQSLSLLSAEDLATENDTESDADDESIEESSDVDQQKGVEGESSVLMAAAYAQLCGFGTKEAAELYVARLKKRGVPAHVVERKSISRRGITRSWYQVVTAAMERKELEDILATLRLVDKLTDIKVIDVMNEAIKV